MPPKRASERTRDDLRKAEREIGANIPDAMVGEDDGDVGDVERHASAEKA